MLVNVNRALILEAIQRKMKRSEYTNAVFTFFTFFTLKN